MTKELILKEFQLNIIPWSFLWLAGVFLVLIPSWVHFVAMSYMFFFFMHLSQMDKANQDLAFVVSLPVPKAGIVRARTATVVIMEVAQLVMLIPLAIVRFWIYPGGNEISMNTNLAFFGSILVMYAVFNLIYLTGSYKRAYRMLWPIAGGYTIAVVVGGLLTTLIMVVPALNRTLNDRGLGNLGFQMIAFGCGGAVFIGLTYLAYRRAVSNFSKVDL